MYKIRTNGIIERKIYIAEDSVRYYVDVDVEGQVVNVKSDSYLVKTKSLTIGDQVEIDYIVSPEGDKSIEIIDEDIILCKATSDRRLLVLVGFGILVLMLAIILNIKAFV